MLETPEDLRPLLRCPVSGEPLRNGADSDSSINGKPVLVDFDSSILRKEDIYASGAASKITRADNSGLRGILRRIANASSRRGGEVIARLVSDLKSAGSRPRVLVVGGGTASSAFRELVYDDPDLRVVVFDIYDSPDVHFIADGHKIPLPDETFDGVIIIAVLEHVLDPQRVADEIWRVLKPGGRVLSTYPFLQAVHEGAYDFFRATPLGHRWLFRRFEEIEFGTGSGPGASLLWSIDYFIRGLFRSRRAGKAAKLAFSWIHLLDRLIPRTYAFDAGTGSHFIGAKRDREMHPSEIVALYRGSDAR